MALPLAVFGIENDAVNTAIKLLVLVLLVLWLALVYYTFADARRRIGDPLLVACAVGASLFPFVGTIVYMIVRPPEFLDDVRERELEIAAAQARLDEGGWLACPHCEAQVEKDFLRCPSCTRKLKDACVSCARPLDPSWSLCPYCEAPVAGAQTAVRASRRRRGTTSEFAATDG